MSQKSEKNREFEPLTEEWLKHSPELNVKVTQPAPPLIITEAMLLSDGRLDEICIVQGGNNENTRKRT